MINFNLEKQKLPWFDRLFQAEGRTPGEASGMQRFWYGLRF